MYSSTISWKMTLFSANQEQTGKREGTIERPILNNGFGLRPIPDNGRKTRDSGRFILSPNKSHVVRFILFHLSIFSIWQKTLHKIVFQKVF